MTLLPPMPMPMLLLMLMSLLMLVMVVRTTAKAVALLGINLTHVLATITACAYVQNSMW